MTTRPLWPQGASQIRPSMVQRFALLRHGRESLRSMQCEHGIVASALKPCVECRRKPPAQATANVDVDEYERELEIRQEEQRSDAKFLRRIGRELIDNGGRDAGLGLKFYDTAIKYERASLETLKEIRDKRHDRWLAAEVARQQGREVGN